MRERVKKVKAGRERKRRKGWVNEEDEREDREMRTRKRKRGTRRRRKKKKEEEEEEEEDEEDKDEGERAKEKKTPSDIFIPSSWLSFSSKRDTQKGELFLFFRSPPPIPSHPISRPLACLFVVLFYVVCLFQMSLSISRSPARSLFPPVPPRATVDVTPSPSCPWLWTG
jgi:hypothetical protein